MEFQEQQDSINQGVQSNDHDWEDLEYAEENIEIGRANNPDFNAHNMLGGLVAQFTQIAKSAKHRSFIGGFEEEMFEE
jgi:hypothetical protein